MRYTKKVSRDGKQGYFRGKQKISKHEYDYIKSHKTNFSQMLSMPAEMKQNVLLQIDDIRTILNMCKSDRDFEQLCRTDKVQKHINNLKIKDLKEKNPHKSLQEILENAVIRGHTEVVKLLLNWVGPNGERVDPTDDNNYAIRLAARNGHTQVVKLLLNWVGPNGERVDLTAENNYAIQMAAEYGHTEVVKLLLNWVGLDGERVDPTDDNNYAIRKAAESGHAEVVKLLLEDERVRNSLSQEELTRYLSKEEKEEMLKRKARLKYPRYSLLSQEKEEMIRKRRDEEELDPLSEEDYY